MTAAPLPVAPPATPVDEGALVAWGTALGRALPVPCVLTLAGDLGAGKTTLAQAICRGFGVTEAVTSPTFALVHRYEAPRGAVYHLDLYRLRGPQELEALGWDDLLSERALVVVEWPDRAAAALPADALAVTLRATPDGAAREVRAG